MKEIINLTPHAVIILRDDAEGTVVGFTGVGSATKEGKFSHVAEYLPTGNVARASQKDEPVGELRIKNGVNVPLITTVFGEPTDLPAPEEGTMYIVSIITAQAAKASGRVTSDLLITSDPIRDAGGKIVGTRKFALL